MRLAAACGLEVATVQLRHLPEPVLMVERFDRRTVAGNGNTGETVDRLHVMDGCQALGLPVDAKYERLYGSGRDVKHIRDGARLPHFFALQQLFRPATCAAAEAPALGEIFQVLIGSHRRTRQELVLLRRYQRGESRAGLRLGQHLRDEPRGHRGQLRNEHWRCLPSGRTLTLRVGSDGRALQATKSPGRPGTAPAGWKHQQATPRNRSGLCQRGSGPSCARANTGRDRSLRQ